MAECFITSTILIIPIFSHSLGYNALQAPVCSVGSILMYFRAIILIDMMIVIVDLQNDRQGACTTLNFLRTGFTLEVVGGSVVA